MSADLAHPVAEAFRQAPAAWAEPARGESGLDKSADRALVSRALQACPDEAPPDPLCVAGSASGACRDAVVLPVVQQAGPLDWDVVAVWLVRRPLQAVAEALEELAPAAGRACLAPAWQPPEQEVAHQRGMPDGVLKGFAPA